MNTTNDPWYLIGLAIGVWSFVGVILMLAPVFFMTMKRRGGIKNHQNVRVIQYRENDLVESAALTPTTPTLLNSAPAWSQPQPRVVIDNPEEVAWYISRALAVLSTPPPIYPIPEREPVPALVVVPEPIPELSTEPSPVYTGQSHALVPQVAQTVPGYRATLAELRRRKQSYLFPVGWYLEDGVEQLMSVSLFNEVNNMLVSGQNDSGKDNEVRIGLCALCEMQTPAEVQVAILDGKGLDWVDWEWKAHLWHLAKYPQELPMAIRKVSKERERRNRILEAAGVKKWADYTGGDLPLLVVFISELKMIRRVLGGDKFEEWLASETAVSRAFGIRFIIGTQTASRLGTDWRSQLALYIGGFQPNQSQDEPNVNWATDDIAQTGAIAPSRLPAPPDGSGIFCVTRGRTIRNVRTPFMSDTELQAILETLPDRTAPASTPKKEAVAPEPRDVAVTFTPSTREPDDKETQRLIQTAYAIGQLEALKQPVTQRAVAEIVHGKPVGGRKAVEIRQPISDVSDHLKEMRKGQPDPDETLGLQHGEA